jgi:hypothetical protein
VGGWDDPKHVTLTERVARLEVRVETLGRSVDDLTTIASRLDRRLTALDITIARWSAAVAAVVVAGTIVGPVIGPAIASLLGLPK